MPNAPILFVDDDVTILMLFSAMLEKSCYPVITAKSGELALKQLEKEAPALVVLDIGMPIMSGIDVLKYIKADPRFDKTKIMILSAQPTRVTPDIAAQTHKVVAKPITPKALKEAIFSLIEPCPENEPSAEAAAPATAPVTSQVPSPQPPAEEPKKEPEQTPAAKPAESAPPVVRQVPLPQLPGVETKKPSEAQSKETREHKAIEPPPESPSEPKKP